MAERISSLKDWTLALCKAINAHLKTSPESRRALKPVLIELRLLSGVLCGLDQLISAFKEEQNAEAASLNFTAPAPWPAVDECERLVHYLSTSYHIVGLEDLKRVRTATAGIRTAFHFVIGTSESLQDVFANLAVLGGQALQGFQPKEKNPGRSLPRFQSPSAAQEEDATPQMMASWLDVLNHSDQASEPEAYTREVTHVQTRNITSPLYHTAAIRWPNYAEEFWSEFHLQICSLFENYESHGRFNFVQWTLEYARLTYPRAFGRLALGPKWMIELTNALCGGSIIPLHMAAALGLPSLCEALISPGTNNVNRVGFLGSPLFCALVGPNVLVTKTESGSWTGMLNTKHANAHRAATILLLLDYGADIGYVHKWHGVYKISLSGLALWAALTMGNEDILTRIVPNADRLDPTFVTLMERDEVYQKCRSSGSHIPRLLTHTFDLTFSPKLEVSVEGVRSPIRQIMNLNGYEFSFKNGDSRLPGVDDERFKKLVAQSIVDYDTHLFQRLSRDPRFDPNMPSDQFGGIGTIFHLAAEGAQEEQDDILDALFEADSDLRARDEKGRTPLMVAEERETLSKLIMEYDAPTTDVDIDGRTVWHYAAATNYYGMIQVLCKVDPEKQQNLATVSKAGATPLAEAFLYVRALANVFKSAKLTKPITARRLLEESHTPETMRSPVSLLELAVEWGEQDLLETLLILGCEAGSDRGPLLRRLHFGVPDNMLQRVLRCCQGSPLTFPDGSSVAELVFVNTVLGNETDPDRFRSPTAHPSCYPAMTVAGLEKLVTPAVLSLKDSLNRGIWQRFCDLVIPKMRGRSTKHPTRLHFLSAYICSMIRLLVERGALDDFERENGKWALLYMADGTCLLPTWERYHFPFIHTYLEAMEHKTCKFLESIEAVYLLSQAVRRKHMDVVRLLINSNLQVDLLRHELGNKSPLESLLVNIELQEPYMDVLTSRLKPGALVNRQNFIVQDLLKLPPTFFPVETLQQLLAKKLIDPNQVTMEHNGLSMLEQVLLEGRPDFAAPLLLQKVDPALTTHMQRCIVHAAERGYIESLDAILNALPPDFDWCFLHDIKGQSYNALQIATMHGKKKVLEWFLQRTELSRCVNDVTPRNENAPIHYAIIANSLDCVTLLAYQGADLEILGPHDLAPFELALQYGRENIATFLLDFGVDKRINTHGIEVMSGWRPAGTWAVQQYVDQRLITREAFHSGKLDPVKLGYILSEMIISYGRWNNLAFKALLPKIPKEQLMAAVLPCRGCTLLSFAHAHGYTSTMLELLELRFGGVITACSKHWVHGYNALFHTCSAIHVEAGRHETEEASLTLVLIRKLLDYYLDSGLLWFQHTCSPLHLVAQSYHDCGPAAWGIRLQALQALLDHLETRASEYWKLMEDAGFTFHCRSEAANETVPARLLRYVVNRRCENLECTEHIGAARTSTLHLLIDGIWSSWNDIEIRNRNLKMVERLVSVGTQVDSQDSNMVTPLCAAAAKGLHPIAKFLLEAGANPNMCDRFGTTPLSRALELDNLEMAHLLLNYGAETSTFLGSSHWTTYTRCNSNLMRGIMDMGIDIHARGPSHSSLAAISIASSPASRAQVLNSDIDWDRLSSEQPSILDMVISRADDCVPIKRVFRRMPPEYLERMIKLEAESYGNVFCYTILKELRGALGVLHEAGWDFEDGIFSDGSALMFACRVGRFRSVKALVRLGARLCYLTTDKHGQTVVKSAIHEARLFPEIVQWLLVGRHQDRRRLEWENSTSDEVAMMPWSGPRKGAYRVSGLDGEYLHAFSDGVCDQLPAMRRIRNIKRKLSGKIVHVTLVDEMADEMVDECEPMDIDS